jgi:hypothetical protein
VGPGDGGPLAKALLIGTIAAAALAGCGPAPEGARAYAEGRWADAHRAFAAEVAAAGDGADSALLHDAALAALRAGALDEAEALAGRSADGEFLRGHAAFLRAGRAEAETAGPRSDASGWDRAIRHATDARDHWARAAAAREGWPEARRNAERAALRIEALEEKRKSAARKAAPAGRPRVVLLPGSEGEDGKGPGEKTVEDASPGAAAAELPAAEVLGVLDRLAAKEKEKRALRLARRREGGGGTERDW